MLNPAWLSWANYRLCDLLTGKYLGITLTLGVMLATACGSDGTPTVIPGGATGGTAGVQAGEPAGPAGEVRPSSAEEAGSNTGESVQPSPGVEPVTPFSDVTRRVLGDGYKVWNDRPGVVIFDYDRDGDLDLYITSRGAFQELRPMRPDILDESQVSLRALSGGVPNSLYRNEGDGTFVDVAKSAGVMLTESHSTGAMACDIDNDGYQDLYVGAWGDPEDKLDFRSPSEGQGNQDYLFLNLGNGTFRDITEAAFGEAVNLRSATSIACADVDGDGWLDIFVGNLMAGDFRDFASPNHPGHYNMLYWNRGDATFEEISEQAGLRSGPILMRDTSGQPVLFEDPSTGGMYEGWDPTQTDRLGNQVGEPTAQTHGALFFDHDDDGDLDLWLADDGDRLKVFRNDTSPGDIRFTSIEREMGIDLVGAWMGFAVADYDADLDLDIFVTNIGYHPVLRSPPSTPTGSCEYHHRFTWGTCLHFLLRNDGTRDVPDVGTIGNFAEVAATTTVIPSPYMPPDSLDSSKVHPAQTQPSGLAAYDFGFGATFFDFDNDGDQDLYWLGSLKNSGAGPGGDTYPGAGRMLRGDGKGGFEDITVRAHLLDIVGVDYSDFADISRSDMESRRISDRFHENGKGLAHGDLDGDGYVDLVGTNSMGLIWGSRDQTYLIPVPGPVFVWMNGGGDNHWITLRLRGRMAVDGTGSNADGVGARVLLTALVHPGEGPSVQLQEVRAGSSYLSLDSIDLEFGLGEATVVDEIKILWPSGRQQLLTDISVDQVLVVTEPPL